LSDDREGVREVGRSEGAGDALGRLVEMDLPIEFMMVAQDSLMMFPALAARLSISVFSVA